MGSAWFMLLLPSLLTLATADDPIPAEDGYTCPTTNYKLMSENQTVSVEPVCDRCRICSPVGTTRSHPYNCSRYYKCAEYSKQWTLHECTHDRIYWADGCGLYEGEQEHVKGMCRNNSAKCGVNSCKTTWPRPCQHGISEPARGSCTKYFECVEGDWFTRVCNEGTIFNSTTQQCTTSQEESQCVTVPCFENRTCPVEKIPATIEVWEESHPGTRVRKAICPKNLTGEVIRRCDSQGLWDKLDYSFCASRDFTEVLNKIVALEEQGGPRDSAELEDIAMTLQNLTAGKRTKPISAGDLNVTVDAVWRMTRLHLNSTLATLAEINAIMDTADAILSDTNVRSSWVVLTKVYESHGIWLLSSLEIYSTLLIDLMIMNGIPVQEFIKDNLALSTERWKGKEMRFRIRGSNLHHRFVSEVFLQEACRSLDGNCTVSVLFFKTIHSVLPGSRDAPKPAYITTVNVNTHTEQLHLPQPVEIMFAVPSPQNNARPLAQCVFWNYSLSTSLSAYGDWDTSGCIVKSSRAGEVTCACNHLTSFAVLVSGYLPAAGHVVIQSIISIIGCGLSIFCLVLTLAAYAISWKIVRSGFAVMLVNLSMALLLANFIFFMGTGQTDNEKLCTAIAVLLHLLYLAVVFFMLAESVELLLSTILIFHIHSLREKFAMVAMAWGSPGLIVAVTIATSGMSAYGHKQACWFQPGSTVMWAFIGPLIAIALINALILGLVLRNVSSSRKLRKQSTTERLGSSVKNIIVLTPIFGFTWIFGIFAVDEHTVVFQYIFIVLNSLQGVFIFAFHCLMHKGVRSYLLERLDINKGLSMRMSKQFQSNTVHPHITTTGFTLHSKEADTEAHSRKRFTRYCLQQRGLLQSVQTEKSDFKLELESELLRAELLRYTYRSLSAHEQLLVAAHILSDTPSHVCGWL